MFSGRALYKIAELDSSLVLASEVGQPRPQSGMVWKQGEAADGLLLIPDGRFQMGVETSYGDHEIAHLEGPFIAGLAEFGVTEARATNLAIQCGQPARFIPEADAHNLLLDDSRLGVSFRRLCLFSLDRALRHCNDQVFSFFREASEQQDPRVISGVFEAIRVEKPADPAEVRAFFDLPEGGSDALVQLGFWKRSYSAGSKLARRGARGDEAFFIRSGQVRVSLKIPGVGEEALSVLGPGQIAGELALIEDGVRSADLIAHGGPVKVYVLNRAGFRRLMSGSIDNSHWLGARIVSALCYRLAEAVGRSISFHMLSAGNRVSEDRGKLPAELPLIDFDFRKGGD